MEAQTHQGHTNYATFGVAVTLQNDRAMWGAVRQMVAAVEIESDDAENVRNGIWTKDQYVRFTLADRIKDYTERLCEGAVFPQNSGHLMASQMIQAGLSEVDWEDVADSFLSD